MEQENKSLRIEQAAKFNYAYADHNFAIDIRQHELMLRLRNAFQYGAKWQKEQGCIQWFEIGSGELPPIDKNNQSPPLLLYHFRHGTDTGYCWKRGDDYDFIPTHDSWKPTHFSYLNKPQ